MLGVDGQILPIDVPRGARFGLCRRGAGAYARGVTSFAGDTAREEYLHIVPLAHYEIAWCRGLTKSVITLDTIHPMPPIIARTSTAPLSQTWTLVIPQAQMRRNLRGFHNSMGAVWLQPITC